MPFTRLIDLLIAKDTFRQTCFKAPVNIHVRTGQMFTQWKIVVKITSTPIWRLGIPIFFIFESKARPKASTHTLTFNFRACGIVTSWVPTTDVTITIHGESTAVA